MSSNDNNGGSGNGGIGFAGVLTLLFIGLKLCEVITWSWWWVLSPLWISFGLYVLLFTVTLAAGAVIAQDALNKASKPKHKRNYKKD